jgi:hypothetical protein
VEVRLRDGSLVIGQLTNANAVELKTAYGTLSFPLANIVAILPALRPSKENDTEIVAAIKNLDNDDFNTRGRAQASLEEFGARATFSLREAREKASVEARTRIDLLLKKIAAQNPKLAETDTVKSTEFEAVGKLQFDALGVKNRIGEFKVKLEDIQSIQWLCHGAAKGVVLDCSTALDEWIDSGIDAVPGEKIVITSSGTITLFGNNQSTPDGSPNFNNGRGFLVGAVVGRIGSSKKPFTIGSSKSWVPQTRGRLYLKIYCPEEILNNNSSNPSTGSYTVRLSSGVLAAPEVAAPVQNRGL